MNSAIILSSTIIYDNIISNHPSGTYGMVVTTGTAAVRQSSGHVYRL